MAPEKTDATDCPNNSSSNSSTTAAAAAPATAAPTSASFNLSFNTSTTENGAGSNTADLSTVSVDSTNGEHDPYFEPVVSLPEVDVKTMEEDEEEIYKGRCKVFRYVHDKEEGGEWRERGTGDVKLLKRVDRGMVRLLMRQEKTLKVRANHYLTPYMKLRPNCGSDRAFVWYVMFDFADEEPKSEMFAIRFANAENARMFKEAFEEAIAYVISRLGDGFCDEEGEEEVLHEKDEEEEDEKTEAHSDAPEQSSSSPPSTEDSDKKNAIAEAEVVEGLEKLRVDAVEKSVSSEAS